MLILYFGNSAFGNIMSWSDPGLFYSVLVWGSERVWGSRAPPEIFFSIFGLQIATFGALWGLFLRFSGLFWTQTAVA